MQLHTLRCDNASIESYIQRAKGITDRLAVLQHPISNDDLVEFVLAGLGPVYRPFTRSLESSQEDITFDALCGLLLNEERQLKRDETITVIAPQPTSLKVPFLALEDVVEDEKGVVVDAPPTKGKGHIARVCPSPKANSGSMMNGRLISNFASSPNPPTQTWLIDSGTTHHITVDFDNLGIYSEYQGPEEVTLGNDSKLPISHVGKSSVIVSNNKFNIDNILHIPIATHNLLSISSFAKSNNVSVELFPNYFLIKDLATREIRYTGFMSEGLYSLPVLKSLSPVSCAASLGV
uniref:Uncharacterized protein LOC104234972 n=1 Tax=Nicotiana sylvestris TaxID=4096 RepID=A0A1U7XBB0_NICSY|nr:PREDICTED: uncharacterized protein LOC104234972 [Nicotiana sylvestris]